MEFRTFIIFAPPGKRVRIKGKKYIIESRIGPYQGVISNMNKKKYIYINYFILKYNKVFFLLNLL